MVTDSLDTSAILAYILGNVPEQREQVWELLNEDNTKHCIADLAISEAVYVMDDHYGQSRKQIVANLRKFLGDCDEVLEYNRELFELVFPCYLANPGLSFNDCCMAYYAELKGAEPLFTFDRGLAKRHASAKLLG